PAGCSPTRRPTGSGSCPRPGSEARATSSTAPGTGRSAPTAVWETPPSAAARRRTAANPPTPRSRSPVPSPERGPGSHLADRIVLPSVVSRARGGPDQGRSIGALVRDHDDDRPDHDPQVGPERPALDVIDVDLEHAFMSEFAAAAHLPCAGQAGEDGRTPVE